MYKLFFKRLLDILIALAVLIVLSPLIIAVVIINYFQLKGNPFFFQERPGMQEKKIKIIKFKSMNSKTDENGKLLPDNLRLTAFGSFIRKASIDELPQLINVLMGDMSLVGPRPLLYKYIPLLNSITI